MGYDRFMGLGPLGHETPANQLGGPKILWVFAGYGLSQVWVKTGRLDPLARKIVIVSPVSDGRVYLGEI